MGMFDAPKYLTGGKEPFVSVGDVFWLHAARMDGTTNLNGKVQDQVKLLVSHDRNGEKEAVWTSGIGIVNQIRRMDATDQANFPMEIRLDEVPSKSNPNNPTRVLTPANQAPPSGIDSDIPF